MNLLDILNINKDAFRHSPSNERDKVLGVAIAIMVTSVFSGFVFYPLFQLFFHRLFSLPLAVVMGVVTCLYWRPILQEEVKKKMLYMVLYAFFSATITTLPFKADIADRNGKLTERMINKIQSENNELYEATVRKAKNAILARIELHNAKEISLGEIFSKTGEGNQAIHANRKVLKNYEANIAPTIIAEAEAKYEREKKTINVDEITRLDKFLFFVSNTSWTSKEGIINIFFFFAFFFLDALPILIRSFLVGSQYVLNVVANNGDVYLSTQQVLVHRRKMLIESGSVKGMRKNLKKVALWKKVRATVLVNTDDTAEAEMIMEELARLEEAEMREQAREQNGLTHPSETEAPELPI